MWTKIYNFLFPAFPVDNKSSLLLLTARIIFSILLMTHGVQKLMNFSELSSVFPDPLGVGHQFSLILAIFGEVVCSIACLIGFLYRLALIPMMFTMIIATFVAHAGDPFSEKELSLVYLFVFLLLYIAGPGKYAIDRLFVKK